MSVDVDEGVTFAAVDEMVIKDLVVECSGTGSSDGHDEWYDRTNYESLMTDVAMFCLFTL
jgi:hypothetical protein